MRQQARRRGGRNWEIEADECKTSPGVVFSRRGRGFAKHTEGLLIRVASVSKATLRDCQNAGSHHREASKSALF